MKGRDLALLAIVLGIAGFATFDALRGDDSSARPSTAPRPEEATSAAPETVSIEPVDGLPQGLLDGRLVYSEARTGCTVGVVDFESRTSFSVPGLRSTCAIVAAPAGGAVAFSLPSTRRDVLPYRVVDLDRPQFDVTSFEALNGSVVWSGDGRRVAWCGRGRQGREIVLGRAERSLAGCPIGYAPNGSPAFVRGDEVFLAHGRSYKAQEPISAAAFGRDGSLALLGPRGHVVVYSRERIVRTESAVLPGISRLRVRFSPLNCSLTYTPEDVGPRDVPVVPIRGCARSRRPREFPGYAVAWSPDERWLAVAGDDGVAIWPAGGGPAVARIGVSAVDLAWTGAG